MSSYIRISDFRQDVLSPGRKSECRRCGQPITLTQNNTAIKASGAYRAAWLHKGEVIYDNSWNLQEIDGDHPAMPKFFCMHELGTGEICGKPIKHEDMEAGHFACGTHMRKELDRVAEEERRRKQEQREYEQNELQKYHVQQYAMARARLINIGLGEIFDPYEPDANHGTWSRREKDESKWDYKVKRIHSFDVLDFEKALMELLRREMPNDFPSGEDDGEKQRLDALADELFG